MDRVATAMVRAPSANSRASVAAAAGGGSTQRASTTSGAPLVISRGGPLVGATMTETSWRS